MAARAGHGVLVIVIAVLAPLGVVARWARNEVASTDRYVQSVAPLASDPAVQAAITNRITNEITRLQVQAVTDQAIQALSDRDARPWRPAACKALGTLLANAIESFIHDAVASSSSPTPSRPRGRRRTARRTPRWSPSSPARDTGGGPGRQQHGERQPATIIDTIKQQLSDRGFALVDKLPSFDAQFTIFQSADITKAQNGFRLLSAVNTWLPIMLLVLLAVAARDRTQPAEHPHRDVLAVAASMLLLGVALNGFRMVYLDALPAMSTMPPPGAIYDTLVWFIRLNLRAILVLTIAVALDRPGERAERCRRTPAQRHHEGDRLVRGAGSGSGSTPDGSGSSCTPTRPSSAGPSSGSRCSPT